MTELSQKISLLKWRARRGLLENDIILERFFSKHGAQLSNDDLNALTELLNLTDRMLMDLLMNKADLPNELQTPVLEESQAQAIKQILQLLQNS